MSPLDIRELVWLGDSLSMMRDFPVEVRQVTGYALYLAQTGGKHPGAKPLRGFGGAGVLEAIDDFDGDTYRAVYTVSFPEAVYVLHAFQKKSVRGRSPPKREMQLVRQRMLAAKRLHEARVGSGTE